MVKQIKYRMRLATALYCILVLAMIVLGSYHLTHGGGWRSGTTELCLAVLSLILAWRVYKIRHEGEAGAGAKHRTFRMVLSIIIFLVVVLFLILSAYHFTHDGLRSGIIELVSAAILTTLGVLIRGLI